VEAKGKHDAKTEHESKTAETQDSSSETNVTSIHTKR